LTATGVLTTLLSTALTASALFVARLLPAGIFASFTICHYCFPPSSIGNLGRLRRAVRKVAGTMPCTFSKHCAQPHPKNGKQNATEGGIAIA
jgi:hypothetical protein